LNFDDVPDDLPDNNLYNNNRAADEHLIDEDSSDESWFDYFFGNHAARAA
jgi:hypothetical protein